MRPLVAESPRGTPSRHPSLAPAAAAAPPPGSPSLRRSSARAAVRRRSFSGLGPTNVGGSATWARCRSASVGEEADAGADGDAPMPMTPRATTDSPRAKAFKKGVDQEGARQRRSDTVTQTRKSEKEERLQRRRAASEPGVAATALRVVLAEAAARESLPRR